MPVSRFHDGRRGVTHLVTIAIRDGGMHIVADDGVTLAIWPVTTIRAAPEIDPDGVVTFTSRDAPGVLSVDDAEDREALHAAGVRLPGERRWTRLHWIAVCGSLVAALGFGGLLVSYVPGWLAAAIPFSWERHLGAPAEALVAGGAARCTDNDGQAALDRLVARLRETGPIGMPVTVTVLNDPLVNAFTLPGGHVLIMRGLIDKVEDGPELAGVIAHELGHVTHRDAMTLLLRRAGLSMLLHMIGFGDTGGSAAGGASGLLSLAYGRAAETAADDTAIRLLSGSGLRADGLSRFFTRMEDTGTPHGHAVPTEADAPGMTWLSTHPPTEERRTTTMRPETGEAPFTEAEWAAIRGMCQKKMP